MQKTLIEKRRWHNRKALIRINCWILVLLLVAILCFMGFPIVSDAEGNKLSDYYFSYGLLNREDALEHFGDENYSNFLGNFDYSPFMSKDNISDYETYISEIFDLDISNFSSNITNFDNYDFSVICNPNDNFLIVAFTLKTNGIKYTLAGNNNNLALRSDSGFSYYYNFSNKTIAYHGGLGLSSISPKYTLVSTASNFKYQFRNTSNIYDINYLALQNRAGSGAGGLIVETPDNTYPDGSGGTVSNNMYLRTADWKFNIPKYWGNVTSVYPQPQYTSQWGSGDITFYGLPNDFQKDNANKFYFKFNFHVWMSGHYFSDVNSSVNGNFYGSFNYSPNDISMLNFVNNYNSISFKVSDIFSYAVNSSGVSVNSFIQNEDIKNHNSIDKWNWYIFCDACLVSTDSTVGDSGHIVEKYDFISQVSQEDSNNITNNSNPYIPPEDSGIAPDANITTPDDSKSYSSNGGNIVINNNPSITNNNGVNSNINNVVNGNGNPFNLLIDKLFGDGTVQEGSIGGNVQEHLLSMTGANRWLAVINDSMSWIPIGVWAEVMVFVGITLGILVVAFILRIILDFL